MDRATKRPDDLTTEFWTTYPKGKGDARARAEIIEDTVVDLMAANRAREVADIVDSLLSEPGLLPHLMPQKHLVPALSRFLANHGRLVDAMDVHFAYHETTHEQ